MPVVSPVAVASAAATGLPILFLDTCALLEVLRFAQRPRKNLPQDIASVQRIAALSVGPSPGVVLVASSLLSREWCENEQSVRNQVERHLNELHDMLQHVADCGTSLGVNVVAPQVRQAGLVPALDALATVLRGAVQELVPTPSIESAAFRRELGGIGPAQKGKQCLKDCIIAETLLDFAASTQAPGRGPLVFLTYNSHDFAEGSKPHADLAADFSHHGVRLALNWSWAAHSLGL